MKPFCMFVGSSSSPMFQWLQEQGVNMIQVCLVAAAVVWLVGWLAVVEVDRHPGGSAVSAAGCGH